MIRRNHLYGKDWIPAGEIPVHELQKRAFPIFVTNNTPAPREAGDVIREFTSIRPIDCLHSDLATIDQGMIWAGKTVYVVEKQDSRKPLLWLVMWEDKENLCLRGSWSGLASTMKNLLQQLLLFKRVPILSELTWLNILTERGLCCGAGSLITLFSKQRHEWKLVYIGKPNAIIAIGT